MPAGSPTIPTLAEVEPEDDASPTGAVGCAESIDRLRVGTGLAAEPSARAEEGDEEGDDRRVADAAGFEIGGSAGRGDSGSAAGSGVARTTGEGGSGCGGSGCGGSRRGGAFGAGSGEAGTLGRGSRGGSTGAPDADAVRGASLSTSTGTASQTSGSQACGESLENRCDPMFPSSAAAWSNSDNNKGTPKGNGLAIGTR
ncbi:MAG TPA: hypothetical protein VFQ61_04925 [Polyangiaceae bacterium]|nr:hypothetical protein [Polyangiaceae bacterium]